MFKRFGFLILKGIKWTWKYLGVREGRKINR